MSWRPMAPIRCVRRRCCSESSSGAGEKMPAAAGGQLAPHPQLDPEVLLDEVVREVVRHQVVGARAEARHQGRTVLTLGWRRRTACRRTS